MSGVVFAWAIAIAACAFAVLFAWYAYETDRQRNACLRGWEEAIKLNDEAFLLLNDTLSVAVKQSKIIAALTTRAGGTS